MDSSDIWDVAVVGGDKPSRDDIRHGLGKTEVKGAMLDTNRWGQVIHKKADTKELSSK